MEERAALEGEREQERIRQETEAFVAKLQQQARQMADQEVGRGQAGSCAGKRRSWLWKSRSGWFKENVSDADRQQLVENYLEKVVRA